MTTQPSKSTQNTNWNDAATKLQEEKLPEIAAVAQKWFDELDNAFSPNSNSFEIQATHQHLLQLIESAQTLVASQGLSSIPLLPIDSSTSSTSKDPIKNGLNLTSNSGTPSSQSNSKQTSSLETSNGNFSKESQQETIKALSDLATESFERRARLKEAAGIVNGILKPGGS